MLLLIVSAYRRHGFTYSAPSQLKVEELISYGRYPHRDNVLNKQQKRTIVMVLIMQHYFQMKL